MEIPLKEIQRTLLMPLWGRSKLTRLGNPILTDPKAVELVDRLKDVDFTAIDKAFSDLFNVGWIVRAKMFDDRIRSFLAEFPRGNIVNLGAGLDTTSFRVDNGMVHWFDLDLVDVIDLRKRLIPETERLTCITGSMFDRGWMKEFQSRGEPVLILAGGVLYYFQEAQVKELFVSLAEHFPGGELIFDTISEASIPFVNKGLQASGNEAASVHWGINDCDSISGWDSRLKVLESYPMFSRIEDKEYWGPAIAVYMAKSDAVNGSAIAHIKFAG